MAKPHPESIERLHVMLYSADVAQLKKLFAESIGVSKAVRLIMRQYLKKVQEKLDQRAANPPPAF